MGEMKKILFIGLALAATIPVVAQSKLDPASRAQLRDEKVIRNIAFPKVASVNSYGSSAGTEAPSVRCAFVILENGASAGDLEAEGMTVRSVRGNIALVEFPASDIERLSSLDCIRSMQLPRAVRSKMDRVRTLTGIDKIHSGEGLPQAYTGAGVVTGIVDNGFDPLHVNFLDNDGMTRVQQMTFVGQINTGEVVMYQWYPSTMSDFIYDTASTFHGTHTAGIMAGNYRGKISTPVYDESTGGYELSEIDNPYYGVATGSDIVMASGDLNDYFIALGCESILDYAFDNNKPAVINLSLGGNTGSHDGTSTISLYLDKVIEDTQVNTIVCMSSGNEGDLDIVLKHEFTTDDEEVKTILLPMYAGNENAKNPRAGSLEIYSEDDSPLEFQAIVVNRVTGRPALRLTCAGNTDNQMTYWASEEGAVTDDEINTSFALRFRGYIGVGSGIAASSGRYRGIFDYYTLDAPSGNPTGQYVLGLLVKGKAGQKVEIYGDGTTTTFSDCGMAAKGFVSGTTDGTISDMATGSRPIVVGSYNVRDNWASLDGNLYGYEGMFSSTTVSDFTSYGTLRDGRQLPDICAPGATVISSTNQYYINYLMTPGEDGDADLAVQNALAVIQASTTSGGRQHSWQQCVGTSMASPVVAGAIALWLEADPTLTNDEAKEIIKSTAIRDADFTNANEKQVKQFGAGKFDAYAGLKEVIRRAGVVAVSADNSRLMVTPVGSRSYEVFYPGVSSVDMKLYSLDGRLVVASVADGDEGLLDASSVASGVYILNVNDTESVKLIIK